MKKITKLFSLLTYLVFAVTIFTSAAYADIPAPICPPGQKPRLFDCVPVNSNPIQKNEPVIDGVSLYNRQHQMFLNVAVGGGIVLVTFISIVVLLKIRQKNDI